MSDKIKALNTFKEMDPLGKSLFIILTCVIFIFAGGSIWMQLSNVRMYDQLVITNETLSDQTMIIGSMVESQEKVSEVKEKINNQVDKILDFYDGEFTRELMDFANEYNMQFNQELNVAIINTKAAIIKMKDIIIGSKK